MPHGYTARGVEMKTYHTIDLREIRDNMGEHWIPREAERYRGYCDCGEEVAQDTLECQYCGMRIIWYGSKLWKNLYGSPDAMVRQLTVRVPEDNAGKYLFEKATLVGFNSQTDDSKWKTATRWFTQQELVDIIDHAYGKGSRRHGLVNHVMAIVNKKGREKRDLKRRKPGGHVDPNRIPGRPPK